MDLARAKVLRSVQRDQRPATEALKRREHAFGLDRLEEHRIECSGRGAIEHQADVGIARDGSHAEQGLTVGPALSFSSARWCARNDGLPMKNTENADRPMSAMLYSPSRRWPLRRSGRPAQTAFSSEISEAKAFTAASSRRNGRAARENRHARCDKMTKSATCCKSDSFRRAAACQGPTRCEPVALRTADAAA